MLITSNLVRAFLWEMSKKWHLLLLGFLGGILPLFLFLWLLTSVGLPILSPEFIRTYTFLMPFSFLALFLGIAGIQGPVRRLYSYPISDSAIALWHMLSGIAIITVSCGLIIQGLNFVFQAGWPIMGPSLYFAMAFAVMQPCTRIAYKTVSTIVTIPAVALILILGFLSRYSAARSQPTLWSELSLIEVCIFAVVTVGAVLLFNRSIKLDRHNIGRSDPLVDLWIRAETWMSNRLTRSRFSSSDLRNGFAAQCWYLWRLNRSVFYLNAIILLLAGIFFATTAIRGATSVESSFVFNGVHGFPLILSTLLAAAMGIGLGSSNTDSSPYRDKVTFEEKLQSLNLVTIGAFLSTLPISNTRLSNAVLLTAFRGVLSSAILTLIAAGTLYFVGIDLITDVWNAGQLGLYLFAILTLPWSAAGLTSTVCLCGRNYLLIVFWFSLIAGIALLGLPVTRPYTMLAMACGATCTNVVLLIKRIARIKSQFSQRHATEDRWQVGFAIVLWIVLLAISWQMPFLRSAEFFGAGSVLLPSICVLPIIAMPLAIRVNRTR